MAERGRGAGRSARRKDRRAPRRARPVGGAARERRPLRPMLEAGPGVRMQRRQLWLLAVSAVAIILGFIALAAGSTVLAPVLLGLGYLVGIPVALMIGGRREAPTAGSVAAEGERSGPEGAGS